MSSPSPLIMLVEDDADTRALYKALLVDEGMEVITFGDGRSCLEWYLSASRRPDLMILDMRLPDTNGLDLCQELRGNHGSDNPPVMLLSAHGDPRMPSRCRKAGVAVFLDKLRDLDQVVPTAKKLLGLDAV